MAVINNNDPNDPNNQQQQPPAMGAGAPPPGTASPGQPQQKSGGGSGNFVNLQKYLNANKNFDTAGAIANKATAKSNETQQGLATGAQAFGQDVNKNTPGYSQDLSNSITANPNSFLNNSENKAALQKIAGGYKGPAAFDTSAYQKQVGQLQDYNNLGQTEQGRYQVLSGLFAKPTYTGGQQKLDQLLLQRQPGSVEKVQAGLGSAANSANAALTGTQASTAQQVTAAQQAANEARQHTQSDISGAYGNTLGEVQKALGQQQAAQNQAIENATGAFKGGNISEGLFNDLNLAGQNRAGVQSMVNEANSLGINPADFLKVQAGQQANLYTAANNDQASRLNALQSIAGLAGSQVGQGQNWGGVAGATNTFNPNALSSTFNSGGLQSRIAEIRQQQAQAAAAKQQQAKADAAGQLNFFG